MVRDSFNSREALVRYIDDTNFGTCSENHTTLKTAEIWINIAKEIAGDALLSVLLFGSFARGEVGDGSDIDLLLVIESAVELKRRLYSSWDEISMDDIVNPHFVHLPLSPDKSGSLWFEAALDGIVLYEKGYVVSRFLTEVRHAIADGQVERKTAYGHAYWIKHFQENQLAQ